LAAGADANCVTDSDVKGWTPLMAAAKAGSTEVVKALLKAGANVNAKNGYGATALDIAISNYGNSSTLAALIQAAGGKGRDSYPSEGADYVSDMSMTITSRQQPVTTGISFAPSNNVTSPSGSVAARDSGFIIPPPGSVFLKVEFKGSAALGTVRMEDTYLSIGNTERAKGYVDLLGRWISMDSRGEVDYAKGEGKDEYLFVVPMKKLDTAVFNLSGHLFPVHQYVHSSTAGQKAPPKATPVGASRQPATVYVSVKANCVVYHSGYRGTITAPGVSEPTGNIARLECNGKDVEIADNKMVAGVILTKHYGSVKVHFGSMVATVGAGDFTSVAPGKTAPERVEDISVQKSGANTFIADFPPTSAQ
jgi:hypothetical protein